VAKRWQELKAHYDNPRIRSFAGVEADRKAANAATKKEETMTVLATNPMQRGFIEQALRQQEAAAAPKPQPSADAVLAESIAEALENLTEGVTVKDNRGDTWKLRHDLVRNKTHPNYWKPTPGGKGSEPASVESINHVSAWHNQRTGQCHEGGVTLHLGGHASMGTGYDSNPSFTHISHYETGKKYNKKLHEEPETVDSPLVEISKKWAQQRIRWQGHTKRDKAAGIKPKSDEEKKKEREALNTKKEEVDEVKGFRKLLKKVSVVPNVAATGAP
jgi:hypothetical protein